jgi:hypothetical protein
MEDLVLVIGSNAASEEQMRACRAARPRINGVLQCDTALDSKGRDLCDSVKSFPAFCDKKTNMCSYQRAQDCTTDSLSSLVHDMRKEHQRTTPRAREELRGRRT